MCRTSRFVSVARRSQSLRPEHTINIFALNCINSSADMILFVFHVEQKFRKNPSNHYWKKYNTETESQ